MRNDLNLTATFFIPGYIMPICLPSFGIQVELLKRDRDPIVIGWGETEKAKPSPILLKADVPFAERKECVRRFYSNFGEEQVLLNCACVLFLFKYKIFLSYVLVQRFQCL